MASNTPIDLRRLDYFVHVVDAPALKDAAGDLCLTQQALSAAIRQLENDLGVALFSRDGRALRITAAGRALYAQARVLLAGSRQAVAAARSAAEDRPRPFTIGYTSTISSHEVYSLVESLGADSASPIAVAQTLPGTAQAGLLDGAFDLVLRRGLRTSSSFADAIVGYHELRLAVSTEHPLASRKTVFVRDLSTYPIVAPASRRSRYHDYLVSLCRRSGFDPDVIVDPIQGAPPITSAVTHRTACVFVTDPVGHACGGRVSVIPFEDPPLAPLQAVWLPHTSSSIRERLLARAASPSKTGDLLPA